MPLRDHFRPPTTKRGSWESLNGMWPAVIVQQLRRQLPPGYISAPRVHLGPYFEIDAAAFQADDDSPRISLAPSALVFLHGDGSGMVSWPCSRANFE